MGGFLVNEKCRPVLGPGSHASTFGGNPVCSAAALAVLDILDEAALNRVREKGAYLRERIEAMGKRCLGATRGLGLMIGVEVRPGWSNRELVARLAGHGLLVLTAGPALRLLPPPDHHEGRDGPGPGHPGPGPGVTPGCARHFCMR